MLKRISILMVIVVMLMAGTAFAAHDDTVDQKINVQAPYILNCLYKAANPVVMEFNESDYAAGYVQKNNQIKMQVGAPGPFEVYILGNNDKQGVLDALQVRASGHGWVDANFSKQSIYSKGSTGLYEFWVDYKVIADQLDPGNNDIDRTVTVTYGFM